MAIAFARLEYVGRSSGGNACCKSAYNERSIITDAKTGITYNFSNRGDNVHHEILLPDFVDKRFSNAGVLSNEVERTEKRVNSQLYLEGLLALPKEENVSLDLKKEMIYEFIKKMGWVEQGLGVQVDIHKPHDGGMNWHVHILVTTRRFDKSGQFLGEKARDVAAEVRYGKVQKSGDDDVGVIWGNIQDDLFKKYGMDIRVDLNGEIAQEHIGPIRMRSILNKAVDRNEERRIANLEILDSGKRLLDRLVAHQNIFTLKDLKRATKGIEDVKVAKGLIEEALSYKGLEELYDEDGQKTGYYTLSDVRKEEGKLLRLAKYVYSQENLINRSSDHGALSSRINNYEHRGEITAEQVGALKHLLMSEGGIRVLRGRAGTGKSKTLGVFAEILRQEGARRGEQISFIGVAPTHKARSELEARGFKQNDTVKGLLFKLNSGRASLKKNSIIVVDEAGMVGNDDFLELFRIAASYKCNVILSGDERQLSSISRGGLFEYLAKDFGSALIADIKRQKEDWGKKVATHFANGEALSGIRVLQQHYCLFHREDKASTMEALLGAWAGSEERIENRLIIAVKNMDVDALNEGAREYLKRSGILKGPEYMIDDHYYMAGDRIVIKETSQALGLKNGDFGFISKIEENQEDFSVLCTIRLDRDETGDQKGKKKDQKEEIGGQRGEESDAKDARDEKDKKDGKDENGQNQKQEPKEITFCLSEYQGFKHGYATTVYKTQGASIEDVYVLHDGYSNMRSSYVALSRFVKSIKLYVNEEKTRNDAVLASQLSFDAELGSSLYYHTKEDLDLKAQAAAKLEAMEKVPETSGEFFKQIGASLFEGVAKYTKNKVTEFLDKNMVNREYYAFKKPSISIREVESVLDLVGKEVENAQNQAQGHNQTAQQTAQNQALEKNQAAETSKKQETNVTIKSTEPPAQKPSQNQAQKSAPNKLASKQLTPKQQFYKKVDDARYQKQREIVAHYFDLESERLRHEVRFRAEDISRSLLGEHNKKLSRGNVYRYGSRGSLAVHIRGSRAGNWYDFEEGVGGDIFALVQKERACDFKGAAQYLRSSLGMRDISDLRNIQEISGLNAELAANNNRLEDKYSDYTKKKDQAAKEHERKLKNIEKLVARSKDIEKDSVQDLYLTDIRHIACALGHDVRAANMRIEDKAHESANQNTNSKRVKYLPAVIAFARDEHGIITGGQQILLDKQTNNKANVDIPKKSFGTISGSFVNLSDQEKNDQLETNQEQHHQEKHDHNKNQKDNITIIAEGFETALSVKQALQSDQFDERHNIRVKILCSLGIGNIQNYRPAEGEKIILAADNDGGREARSYKTIENAKTELENKGAFVEIVMPKEKGDFNDILRKTSLSPRDVEAEVSIQEIFSPAIKIHTAKTVEDLLVAQKQDLEQVLDKNTKYDLAYFNQYKEHIDHTHQMNIVDAFRKGDIRKEAIYADEIHKDDRHQNQVAINQTATNQASNLKGKIALEDMRKSLEYAKYHISSQEGVSLLEEIHAFGGNIHQDKLIGLLACQSDRHQMEQQLRQIRDKHYVQHSLKEIAATLAKTTTPKDAIKAIYEEEKFWIRLPDNIKGEKMQDEHRKPYNMAMKNDKSQEILKLHETARYAFYNNILGEEELTNILKSRNLQNIQKNLQTRVKSPNGQSHMEDVHKHLIHACFEHNRKVLNTHCPEIAAGKKVHHMGKDFTCVRTYLEHFKEHTPARLMPIAKVNKVIDQLKEQELQHEMLHVKVR